MKDALTVRQ